MTTIKMLVSAAIYIASINHIIIEAGVRRSTRSVYIKEITGEFTDLMVEELYDAIPAGILILKTDVFPEDMDYTKTMEAN